MLLKTFESYTPPTESLVILQKQQQKTVTFLNILKNSYFYSIVDKWNGLPLEVRSACTVDKFKASVIKFVTNSKYYYSF